jgi:hypothetical protein
VGTGSDCSHVVNADLGLRRDAVFNGSSASIAVDSNIATSVLNRKGEMAMKRSSLVLELETDSSLKQEQQTTGLVVFSCMI